ncbi:MAG: LPS assembly lipoprotein LptE [Bacteroidota bacterium]|nr:LPS assembly lipoprotein LptE [Bacteroidota bacterium]
MKLKSTIKLIAALSFLLLTFCFATCKYSTRDTAPIPTEIKTFRVSPFENKARYVNPQITPQLTEKLKQKIISQTRLRQTNNDDAHYDISGYLSDYSVTTSGVANQTAGTNRINVTFHLIFRNTLDPDPKKSFEADLTSNYDFPASQSLQEAEASKGDLIIKTVTDAIFNRIFSNW